MKVISTPNAPAAIGPYSQGMILGELVFCSGQIPVDPATGAVPEGIRAQAEQSCKNVSAVLAAAGTDCTKVVKTTCFLSDTPLTSPESPPEAAAPCGSCPRACCARSKPSPSSDPLPQTAPVPKRNRGGFCRSNMHFRQK